MKKLFIGLAVTGLFLAGCQKKEAPAPAPKPAETRSTAQTAPSPATEAVIVEKVYEGILPCADCSGIKTRVKISSKEGDATGNVFEKTMTYMGKEPNNVFVTTGNYTVRRGMDNDANAVVYILNPDKAKDEQDYYAIYSNDPATMYSLDGDMKKIESGLNYALKLIN
ncbi:copper resistance protein NlpE [Oxalobacter sp. OttesenSCG-928-P03]|nr:copper resistance protein NlpE [Oxalobacter sp. OttesenSCG-928-P03]